MNDQFFAFAWLLALSFLPSFSYSAGAQNVEELLDKINRLPVTERQQRLTDGARKEGELVWYSTMNRENSQELINLFQKDHPYIRVKLLNGSAVQTMTRVSSEYSAKSYLFDITHIRGLFLSPLRKRQIIAAYRSPFRDALAPATRTTRATSTPSSLRGNCFWPTETCSSRRTIQSRSKTCSPRNGKVNWAWMTSPTTGLRR